GEDVLDIEIELAEMEKFVVRLARAEFHLRKEVGGPPDGRLDPNLGVVDAELRIRICAVVAAAEKCEPGFGADPDLAGGAGKRRFAGPGARVLALQVVDPGAQLVDLALLLLDTLLQLAVLLEDFADLGVRHDGLPGGWREG